jgi:hypothetical protein
MTVLRDFTSGERTVATAFQMGERRSQKSVSGRQPEWSRVQAWIGARHWTSIQAETRSAGESGKSALLPDARHDLPALHGDDLPFPVWDVLADGGDVSIRSICGHNA